MDDKFGERLGNLVAVGLVLYFVLVFGQHMVL